MERIIYGGGLLMLSWVALTQFGGLIRGIQHPTTVGSLVIRIGLLLLWGLAVATAYRGLRHGDLGKWLPRVVLGVMFALLALQSLI